MYSDFIEDRLAQNSEYIALLKKGIQDFEPDWLESNFRQKLKYETLRPVDQFFDNLYFDYDDNEKLFIYKSTYSQAGFKESLKNLEKFAPGLKVDITTFNVNYTPYLNFTKQGDGSYKSEASNSSYYSLSGFQFSDPFSGQSVLVTTSPYTINLASWTSIDATLTRRDFVYSSSSTFKNILFNDSPYITGYVSPGEQVKLTGTSQGNPYEVVLKLPNSLSSGSQPTPLLDSVWFIYRDDTASEQTGTECWMLLLANSYSYIQPTAAFSRPVSPNITVTKNQKSIVLTGDTEKYVFSTSDGYCFSFNPLLIYQDGGTNSPILFPGQDSATATPAYNITVSTTGEIFKDYELFQARFDYLVKELLFYYGEPITTYYITFEVNAVNAEKHHLNINSRIYRFANISGAGLYE